MLGIISFFVGLEESTKEFLRRLKHLDYRGYLSAQQLLIGQYENI